MKKQNVTIERTHRTHISAVNLTPEKASQLAKKHRLPVVLHSIYHGGIYLPDGSAHTPRSGGSRFTREKRLTYGVDLVRSFVECNQIDAAREVAESWNCHDPIDWLKKICCDDLASAIT